MTTTHTAPHTTGPARAAAPGPAPVAELRRGAIRVALRQHRWALRIAAVLTVLVAGAAAGTRWWMEATGAPLGGRSQVVNALRTFVEPYGTGLLLLPLLVGAFVAGPLVARELESGTYKLAWTQSVSPARWLAVRLALPLTVVVTGALLLVAGYRLARAPFTGKPYWSFDWYQFGVYESLGPVTVAYCVLGVTAGALLGLLVRRAVVSMAVTAAVLGGVLAVMKTVRGGLWPVRTKTGDDAADMSGMIQVWLHDAGWMDASGVRIDTEPCAAAGIRALNAHPDPSDEVYGQVFDACVKERGGTTQYVDYHTLADLWPLQLVESGVVLALAVVAGALAFRVLRRMHG
ncbi:ABC transporter permease [Streptomyces sp. NPDC087440]|uniref:ABC transporter permease n=1 Tax=Streptomyces sp. NPDC087440 TaxID=3365790 RepID=UPI0037F91622